MVGCRRWMIGVRIFWNICRVCERKGSRVCSMICVCVPLVRRVVFMWVYGVECVSESMVVEVLSSVVGPVAESVLHGHTRVYDEGSPMWDEVFKSGYYLD